MTQIFPCKFDFNFLSSYHFFTDSSLSEKISLIYRSPILRQFFPHIITIPTSIYLINRNKISGSSFVSCLDPELFSLIESREKIWKSLIQGVVPPSLIKKIDWLDQQQGGDCNWDVEITFRNGRKIQKKVSEYSSIHLRECTEIKHHRKHWEPKITDWEKSAAYWRRNADSLQRTLIQIYSKMLIGHASKNERDPKKYEDDRKAFAVWGLDSKVNFLEDTDYVEYIFLNCRDKAKKIADCGIPLSYIRAMILEGKFYSLFLFCSVANPGSRLNPDEFNKIKDDPESLATLRNGYLERIVLFKKNHQDDINYVIKLDQEKLNYKERLGYIPGKSVDIDNLLEYGHYQTYLIDSYFAEDSLNLDWDGTSYYYCDDGKKKIEQFIQYLADTGNYAKFFRSEIDLREIIDLKLGYLLDTSKIEELGIDGFIEELNRSVSTVGKSREENRILDRKFVQYWLHLLKKFGSDEDDKITDLDTFFRFMERPTNKVMSHPCPRYSQGFIDSTLAFIVKLGEITKHSPEEMIRIVEEGQITMTYLKSLETMTVEQLYELFRMFPFKEILWEDPLDKTSFLQKTRLKESDPTTEHAKDIRTEHASDIRNHLGITLVNRIKSAHSTLAAGSQ